MPSRHRLWHSSIPLPPSPGVPPGQVPPAERDTRHRATGMCPWTTLSSRWATLSLWRASSPDAAWTLPPPSQPSPRQPRGHQKCLWWVLATQRDSCGHEGCRDEDGDEGAQSQGCGELLCGSWGLHHSQRRRVDGAQSCPASHQPLVLLSSSPSSCGTDTAPEQHGPTQVLPPGWSPGAGPPRATAAPSYLLVRGCPRGRVVRCRARLPWLPQPHTAHVTPEEIGSSLGRKLKQRAPRCRSTPHPRAPWGSSGPLAQPAPRLPQPTLHPAAGLPGRPGGTPKPPGPDGRWGQTHRTPCPGMASSPASTVGEWGWVRMGHRSASRAGTPGRDTARPHRHQSLALWSPPGCRIQPHEPQGRVAPVQPPLTVGPGAGRSSTKLLGKSPLWCRHCPSHQPSTSVRCGRGQASAPGTSLGVAPVPAPPSPC